jgi:hypothetical protein
MSHKLDSEVPALISAVLEYKKFKQLACYSIECVTKVIAPINRDYKKNLQIAFLAQAPKCVVEVLTHHVGKEDCLLVCVDCLHKLAVDDDNAEAIAREGGVRAVLASIGAIPSIGRSSRSRSRSSSSRRSSNSSSRSRSRSRSSRRMRKRKHYYYTLLCYRRYYQRYNT